MSEETLEQEARRLREAIYGPIDDAKMRMTSFGWALESDRPIRRDLFWIPLGTEQIYTWDGDGWYRIRPPDRVILPEGDLKHG